ncbi:LOW QUALITY PROTEIN: uncharacterized protein ACMZJ9_009610 [Mantella aurantiaca]
MAKRLQTTNTTKLTVYEHALSSDGKHYVCQCIRKDYDGEKQCDAKISSFGGPDKNAPTRASNLKRHLQHFHPKVLEALNEKDSNENIASTSVTKNVQKSTGEQSQIRKFFIPDKVTISMTPEKFKQHIIEMVVKNSVPLSFFSQTAFLGLNGEMAKKLGVSLERESIRKLIIEEAKYKKEELQKVLKGRFVFLKFDACTRHRINYFAINVRFVDENNKTITRTLGLKDTQAHHTSDYLQKLVEGVLEDFEIKKEQILCVVTDNAFNMVSTIEKMNADEEGNKQILELEEDSSASIGESLETEENAGIFLDNFIEEALKISTIHHMRCAVHTLQLAIRDGLKDRHAATLIGKLRQVTVAARAPKTDAILKRRAGKGAILDPTTRWGSTYLMVKRLLELKDFIEEMDNENLALTESQWTQTKELENLLSHPFNVTKRLQCDDLTPGKFLLEWKSLLYRLNKNGGLIAEGIASSMRKRESLLLENELLLAAIYVDPMSRLLLNSEQTATGKKALYELAVRMKGLRPEIPLQDEVILSNSGVSGSSSSNEELDFDSFLDKMEVSKGKRRRISVTASAVESEEIWTLAGKQQMETHDGDCASN